MCSRRMILNSRESIYIYFSIIQGNLLTPYSKKHEMKFKLTLTHYPPLTGTAVPYTL